MHEGNEIGALYSKYLSDFRLFATGIVGDQHEEGIIRRPQLERVKSRQEFLEHTELCPPQAVSDNAGGGGGVERHERALVLKNVLHRFERAFRQIDYGS